MAQGTIKKIVSGKGFGFIEGERGELFFHHTAVEHGMGIADERHPPLVPLIGRESTELGCLAVFGRLHRLQAEATTLDQRCPLACDDESGSPLAG